MKIKLVWLYPELMNTYGDRGNILVLMKRCGWRDIEVELVMVERGEELPSDYHLLFMGGAQDRQQRQVMEDLKGRKTEIIKSKVEDGAPALFVCAGYQLLGEYYQPFEGEKIEGMGLVDFVTLHPGERSKRLIGNIVVDQLTFMADKSSTLVGFENHGGRTFLGSSVNVLGQVRSGFGNNGEDGGEGICYHRLIASYLHGPILAKNPHLADYLIKEALLLSNSQVELSPLDDNLIWQAHDFMCDKTLKGR